MSDPLPQLLSGCVHWLVGALLTAAAAGRFAAWAMPPPPDPAERYLRWFVGAAFLVVAQVACLGFVGHLGAGALLVAGAVCFALSRLVPPRETNSRAWLGRRARALLPAVVVGLAIVAVDLPIDLAAPPSNWDAMTYHLFFPVRWIQDGRIIHIPTVFSDNAAAFAPQNGALLFAWSMALLRSDAACNVLQFLGLVAAGCAVYRIARELGCGARAAAWAAAALAWLPPLRQQVASANVDGWMLAFWLAGLSWLVAYARRPRLALLVAAGLASGLAAGTKTVGLSFALGHALVALLLGAARRRPTHVAACAAAAALGGVFWFARNAVLYGNPLFPLRVGLGRWELPGAYDIAAVRAGEFHVAAPGRLAALVYDRWGAVVCALLLVGLVALLWRCGASWAARDRLRRRWPGTIVALEALGAAALYVWGLPHNSQTRFLLPCLLAAACGWAWVLHGAERRRRHAGAVLGLALCAALALAGRPDGPWRARAELLSEAGIALAPLFLAAAAFYAAGALACFARQRPRRLALVGLATVCATAALSLGVRAAEIARPAFLARANYGVWADGFVPLHDPTLPPLRVAYTGANVPYALVGPALRHRVVYCNTQGDDDDGFYELWRRDPRSYDYHKPGLYRGREDDYERWLAHLRAARIDLLVIFALHPVERRYLATTPDGFPVEQVWARRHPEHFVPVTQRATAEIYRLRWDGDRAPSTVSPGTSPSS